jgi:predicted DNA-binding transcriptional regulator AlpA
MESPTDDRLISTHEAQQIIGRSRTTLWRLGLSGDLTPRQIRGRKAYLKSEVLAYIRSLPVVSRTEPRNK